MTLDDYIKIFREECGEHLPWEEARDCEGLWVTRDAVRIYEQMNKLRDADRIPSPRFKKTLGEFFWDFVY